MRESCDAVSTGGASEGKDREYEATSQKSFLSWASFLILGGRRMAHLPESLT